MPSNAVADALGRAVLKVVEVFERAGGLDLRRMHRILVVTDFTGELAELSAATASGDPITSTDEEYAIAVARVQILPRGEDYEIVPVVGAGYALPLLTRITVAGSLAATTGENFCIARKDIILGAVDKEGGAHVDEKPAPDYERLASTGVLRMYEGEINLVDGRVVRLPPLEDAPFVFLRQMGYEVLESPGVRGLLSIYY